MSLSGRSFKNLYVLNNLSHKHILKSVKVMAWRIRTSDWESLTAATVRSGFVEVYRAQESQA